MIENIYLLDFYKLKYMYIIKEIDTLKVKQVNAAKVMSLVIVL